MVDLDQYFDAIVAGDSAAFARWVAGAELALRLSLVRFASQVDVEVVVQEALLRTWHVAPQLERDGKGNTLLRFATRAARNLAIDELRRCHAGSSVPVEEVAIVPPVEPDPLLRRAVTECRERLPAQPAKVLDARLAAEGAEPDATLATELGMKLNTFLKNFGRARQLLLDCLRHKGIALGWEAVP
jgi:DNA-directed RNA polymerase specialized sigma24 family protein